MSCLLSQSCVPLYAVKQYNMHRGLMSIFSVREYHLYHFYIVSITPRE